MRGGTWKRTVHASTAGRRYGKCRHEKPSPFAHGLCATCVATSGVITAYTAYHLMKKVPSVIAAI